MADLGWFDRFHGFLFVDKPEGITSQDVITRLQRALIEAGGAEGNKARGLPLRKRDLPSMGHGGTLDPFATGLLVVAVGDGVKLTRYLLGSDKSYLAELAFGARTASGDRTNEIVERTDRLPRNADALARAAEAFLSRPYLQTPPMYSAKKIDGVPLYELARKGVTVERPAIPCAIRALVIESVGIAPDGGVASARIRTTVSSGTFIRTLAEDLAQRAESLAHLTSLRRLASGSLSLDRAVPLADLTEALAAGHAGIDLPCFVPFHRALDGILPRLEITTEVAARIFSGEVRTVGELPLREGGSTALYAKGRLVAVVRERDEREGTGRVIERGFPMRFDDPV